MNGNEAKNKVQTKNGKNQNTVHTIKVGNEEIKVGEEAIETKEGVSNGKLREILKETKDDKEKRILETPTP